MTSNMKNMMKTVSQSNANPVNPTESEALRITIREEVEEMEEREEEVIDSWEGLGSAFWYRISESS